MRYRPPSRHDESPDCATRGCDAVATRRGYCDDCYDAAAEDADEARREYIREARRNGDYDA